MLDYVLTNIFDSPAQTLVNTVNTVGIMGKGIAAEYKRRYPDMFRRYRQHCKSGSLDIGKLYLYKGDNKWVLNFPTKEHWRNPSKVEYLEAGLQKFVATYAAHGITSVSFPQLGTGNGGLDWTRVVRPLMDKYLSDLAIPVFIHVARRTEDFVPEHIDRRQLRAPRVAVGFEEFFSDLKELAEVIVTSPTAADEDMKASLPALHLGAGVTIPGEDFAVLWEELRLRRAIRKSAEFSPLLAKHWEAVTRFILQLGYIEPIAFEGETGIRFAPTPAAEPHPTPTFVVAVRETVSR